MNTLVISGKVLGCGSKNTKFPNLWLKLELDPISVMVGSEEKRVDKNIVFVNAPYPADKNTAKGSVAEYILTNYQDKYAVVYDATAAPIKRARKKDDGTWENYDEFGITNNISRIRLFSHVPAYSFNTGLLSAKVVRQSNQFIIAQETYRVPTTNEQKTREIPLFIPETIVPNLTDKYIVATYKITGTNFSGESKTFCIVSSYSVI